VKTLPGSRKPIEPTSNTRHTHDPVSRTGIKTSSRAAIARPVQRETIVLAGSRQRVVSEITTGNPETAHPDGRRRPLSIPLPRPWTLRQHAPIRIRLQLSPRQCNESSTKMRRLVKHLHFLKTKMLMRHPVYFLKIT
jgi:hypothetical protein